MKVNIKTPPYIPIPGGQYNKVILALQLAIKRLGADAAKLVVSTAGLTNNAEIDISDIPVGGGPVVKTATLESISSYPTTYIEYNAKTDMTGGDYSLGGGQMVVIEEGCIYYDGVCFKPTNPVVMTQNAICKGCKGTAYTIIGGIDTQNVPLRIEVRGADGTLIERQDVAKLNVATKAYRPKPATVEIQGRIE